MTKRREIEFLFWAMASLAAFATGVTAQTRETKTPLQSLVETEQAFSQAAMDKSTREAFVQFIADDGILFRPQAVNGKQWMRDHPLPPSDTPQKRPLLAWQPVFADVAQSGELGYTTGPWEYKEDIKDAKPSAYGDFVTLWKKQANGSWKFAVDLGISHPQSSGPLALWSVTNGSGSRPTQLSKAIDLKRARKDLVRRDLEFSDASMTMGFAKAFQTFAAADVRLFREKSNPFIGKEAAAQALTSQLVTWQATGYDVSRSGDLGYTYGTYSASDGAAKKLVERGNYVRIWKKQNDVWKVVLDLANPLPPQ